MLPFRKNFLLIVSYFKKVFDFMKEIKYIINNIFWKQIIVLKYSATNQKPIWL